MRSSLQVCLIAGTALLSRNVTCGRRGANLFPHVDDDHVGSPIAAEGADELLDWEQAMGTKSGIVSGQTWGKGKEGSGKVTRDGRKAWLRDGRTGLERHGELVDPAWQLLRRRPGEPGEKKRAPPSSVPLKAHICKQHPKKPLVATALRAEVRNIAQRQYGPTHALRLEEASHRECDGSVASQGGSILFCTNPSWLILSSSLSPPGDFPRPSPTPAVGYAIPCSGVFRAPSPSSLPLMMMTTVPAHWCQSRKALQ